MSGETLERMAASLCEWHMDFYDECESCNRAKCALEAVERRTAERCREIAFDADTNYDAKDAIAKEFHLDAK